MSDSDEGALQIDLDRPGKSSHATKKPKLKRYAGSLKVRETEEEIKFRSRFQEYDVTKEFSELIKCTKCLYNFKHVILEGKKVHSHPILEVLMCDSCCLFYGNGEFSLDEDGEDKYCRWCGEGGKIFLCSECICGFCPKCIKKNFGKRKVREIERDDEWLCFICNPKPIWKLRAICCLAKRQSFLNKAKLDALRETPRKKQLSRLKSSRQYRKIETLSNDDTENNRGDSINDDSQSSSKDTVGSFFKMFPGKRKRVFSPKPKAKATKISPYDLSDDGDEPPRKMRSASLRSAAKMAVQSSTNSNGSEVEFSTPLTDSSDDENENITKLRNFNEREMKLVEKTKMRNLDKLKDIFTVAETVSELCLNLCKKKIKKLDKNMLPEEKILPECEKLRSMIILMSCSLSTVHNMIVALQEKCRGKEKLDIQSRGKRDSTLLEAFSKILREKKMKTSYFFDIVSDILNRYPFIELGVQNFNNCVSSSKLEESTPGRVENGSCHNVTASSAPERNGRNEQNKNVEKNIVGGAETVTQKVMNLDVNTTEDSSKKITHKADVSTQICETDFNEVSSKLSTEVLETGVNEVASNPSGHSPSQKESDQLNTSLQDNNDSVVPSDMEKLYLESLKLKEQMLLSSSDESFSDDEVSSLEGDSVHKRNISTVKRKTRKQTSVARATDRAPESKEDREIRRLMDLRSLERVRVKKNPGTELNKDSGSDIGSEIGPEIGPEIGLEERNLNELHSAHGESGGSKAAVSDVSESLNDPINETSPYDMTLNDSPLNDLDFMRENVDLAKSYFLNTSSSSNDDEDNASCVEKPKKRRSTGSSNKVEKPDRKKKAESDWRSDKLLRCSLSFADPKRNNGTLKPKQGDADKGRAKENPNASDSSSSSINISSERREKRKRVFVDSSSESDIEEERLADENVESPQKGRRNIKKILKTGNLQLETKQAVKMENERKKRVAERKVVYQEIFPDMLESDRLVLDFDPETKDVLLEVPKELAQKLKPHQKEGIKFMWDCCFESLESLEQNNGSGCVLAHCMGLGKTLQMITLIFTIMKNRIGVKTILILCPLNVITNWVDEFETWLKDLDFDITVHNLNNIKGDDFRLIHLRHWQNEGGVMIVSYDLLRNLTTIRKSKGSAEKAPQFSELLLDPGPNLVICDEGHLLKNQDTALWKCIMKINTSRRIILTGTPLQNNLIEYHSMIQFIKPNILGSRKEFMNRFVNPILNGQFEDSTAHDVKLMRARSHVLHKLLDGCIQRFSYSVLTPYLPEKQEYVLSIRLTNSQANLYQYFIDRCRKSLSSGKTAKLFSDFHLLQRVWTHPRLIATCSEMYTDSLFSDLDDNRTDGSSSDESVICLDSNIRSSSPKSSINDLLKPEEYEVIQSGGKLVLLFQILSGCKKFGDKVLVFSQSLHNLDLIEHFLHKINMANKSGTSEIPVQYRDNWEKGIDYYRMEGSTSYEARTKWCKSFNNGNNKRARLFLISTKAGGLGINLVGANRVVIFDVSWNPSHDVQSIFRVYRFGQLKTCYIYRFVAQGTMEEKIYARQVTKLSLEKRILDEQQIERHYTMGNLQGLYTYDPMPKEKWKVPLIPKDMILAEIINNKDLIACYHEHDSLLENKEEDKLTEEERKAAWEDFEKEKFMAEYQLNRYTTNNSANISSNFIGPARGSPNPDVLEMLSATRYNPQHPNFLPFEFLQGLYNQMNNPLAHEQFRQAPCMPSTSHNRNYLDFN